MKYFDMDSDLNTALLNWFSFVDGSSLEYTEQCFEKGIFNSIYSRTQQLFKEKGIKELKVYRWETGSRDNKVLESWCPLLYETLEFKGMRGGKGELLERVVPAEDVLFFTDFIPVYYDAFDEVFGGYPGNEVIVMRNKYI